MALLQGREGLALHVITSYSIHYTKLYEAAPEPEIPAEVPASGEVGDAYVLHGEVKASRFSDIASFADSRDAVQIDCSGLKRLDFISAGALLNALTSVSYNFV